MALSSKTILRFLLALIFVCSVVNAARAQTPSDLRAKYGEPQMSKLANNHPVVERYLVRPNILMTIRYTKDGLPCEAMLEPVPDSTPKEGRVEHAPEGDYLATAEVIKLINELVPVEKRGRKTGEGSINGGDPEMKLHHPGCWGASFIYYENVSFTTSTWCQGGTFSATIHWGKTTCPGQTITYKKR